MSIDQFYSVATVTNPSTDSVSEPNDGYSGIPFAAYAQRTNEGIDLNIYSSSNSPYKLEVNGIKSLSKVDINDAFSNGIYYSYFVYAVASFLRAHYEKAVDLNIERMREQQRHRLRMIKPQNTKIDDSMRLHGNNWYGNISDAGPMSVSKGWS